MNWTAALFLATCLQVSAAGYSQGRITLSLKKAPLQKAFAAIESQSGYTVWYDIAILKNTAPVDIDVKDVSLEEALTIACLGQSLEFSITDKMIVIKAKTVKPGNDPQEKVDVKGRVLNEKGEPAAGISVIIKDSHTGTMTDIDGRFELANIDENSVLVFSGANIETEEEPLNRRKDMVVVVKTKISRLDDVQIIGYGITTKRLSTGNVSTVDAEVIERQPITNPLQALEGRVAGLQITQGSGLPGTPVTVQIRGQNSIAASNNPLYIVDGVPFTSNPVEVLGGANGDGSTIYGSPLNSLDPADIESISILKDADATAIYGSRGSNGVILITTRKGKPGKSHLDLNINSGAGTITRHAKTWNTAQYLAVRKDAFAISGTEPTVTNAPDLKLWNQTSDFDWQNWYMGNTARSFNGTATLSGGSDQTTFLLSGTYHHETTVLTGNTSYNRGGFHLNLNHRSANKRFLLTTGIFYTTDNNLLSGNFNGALSGIVRGIANYPIYDSLGKLNWTGGQDNYVAQALAYSKNKTDNLNADLLIRYQILKGLTAEVNLGYNEIEINQLTPSPVSSKNPAFNPKGSDKFGTNAIHTYVVEPQLSFARSFLGGNLGLLAGSTFQHNITQGQFLIKGGYTDDLLIESMNYGTVNYVSASTVQYKYASLFGRFTFNRENKYLLNGNFRRDGSSRFGPDKQFGNFWSLGSAWVFSNESFLKDSHSWLSYGKLRGSIGITGNDGIGDYGYLSTYTNTIQYGATNAVVPSAQIANPNFQWEVNRKLEAALELGFWHDRLLLSTSFYRNRSSNQLINYSLPSITGSVGYTANLPAIVQNEGWEFELNDNLIRSNSSDWTISANLTIPNNKLVAFPDLYNSSYANGFVIGQPLSIVQAFHFTGVDPSTGETQILDVDKSGSLIPSSSYNQQGGDYIIAGKTVPSWYAGMGSNFRYDGFQLDLFFQYVRQQGYNLYALYGSIGEMLNGWNAFLPYWKKPGDQHVLPAPSISYNASLGRFTQSDVAFSDASFFRLKNASLSYQIPEKWLKSLKIASLRIYLQGQNLLTLTRYKGYDPENASNRNLVIPPLKMLTAGIKCSL